MSLLRRCCSALELWGRLIFECMMGERARLEITVAFDGAIFACGRTAPRPLFVRLRNIV